MTYPLSDVPKITSETLNTVESLLTDIQWKDHEGSILRGLEMIGIVNRLFPERYARLEYMLYRNLIEPDDYIEIMEDLCAEIKKIKLLIDIEAGLVNM